MKWYFEKFEKWGLEWQDFVRVDINVDFAEDTDYITRTVFDSATKAALKKRAGIFVGKKGDIETLYIGEVSLEKNPFKLVRVYNKTVEMKKRGKEFLYPEYQDIPCVTRIELELRRGKLQDL